MRTRSVGAAPDLVRGEPKLTTRGPRKENMLATLDMVRREYGSVEGYILNHLRLSADDIRRIRENLVVDAPGEITPST